MNAFCTAENWIWCKSLLQCIVWQLPRPPYGAREVLPNQSDQTPTIFFTLPGLQNRKTMGKEC